METDSRSDGSSLSAGATAVGRVQGPKDPEISSSRKAVTTPTFWRAQGGNGVFGSGGLPRSRRKEDHSSQMQLWSRRDRSLPGADQGAWGEVRGGASASLSFHPSSPGSSAYGPNPPRILRTRKPRCWGGGMGGGCGSSSPGTGQGREKQKIERRG